MVIFFKNFKKPICGVVLALIVILASYKTLSSWACMGAILTHQLILKKAYKKLEVDPVVKELKYCGKYEFPSLAEILKHEGVDFTPKLGAGAGADSEENSYWADHWYNPRLPGKDRGNAPRTAGIYFEELRDALLYKEKDPARPAAYLAHFIADLSTPFHVNGMPANAAVELYKALIEAEKDKSGTKENEVYLPSYVIADESAFKAGLSLTEKSWKKSLKRWYNNYKDNKRANWFDAFYQNGLTGTDSNHILWEAGIPPAARQRLKELNLVDYSPLYSHLASENPVVNSNTIEKYARKIAAFTSDNQGDWIFKYWKGVNYAIRDVYTAWRASFSALDPHFEIDPKTKDLHLRIKNLEEYETVRDVSVEVILADGMFVHPEYIYDSRKTVSIDEISPKKQWKGKVGTIKWAGDEAKIKIVVKGNFTMTPDSGWRIYEEKIDRVKNIEAEPEEPEEPKQTEEGGWGDISLVSFVPGKSSFTFTDKDLFEGRIECRVQVKMSGIPEHKQCSVLLWYVTEGWENDPYSGRNIIDDSKIISEEGDTIVIEYIGRAGIGPETERNTLSVFIDCTHLRGSQRERLTLKKHTYSAVRNENNQDKE